MKRQKKSNNIFNKPILPESLFYEQVQKDYKIGGVKVEGRWLQGSTPLVYQSSVKSALQLSDLKAQLTQLKKNGNQSTADLFRMAELRKKMQNFEILAQSPTKKRQQQMSFKIEADNLLLQKISNFWGAFMRKCKVEEKQLFVQSQKQKKQKVIDLKPYTIEIEQKGKANKQSQQFLWPEERSTRLFLHGQNLRSYCIYGDELVLKNILKKIKIQSIEISQIDFFNKLSKQYEQKVIILFGNRLRVYEHMIKESEKHNLNIAFDLIERSHLLDEVQEQPSQRRTGEKVASFLDESFHHSQSSKKQTSVKNNTVLNKSTSFLNSSSASPLLTPGKSPILTESQFKLKVRRSTVNYQDLDHDDDDDDNNMNIQDFKLEIKQVAHSDSEEEANKVDNWGQLEGNQIQNYDMVKRRQLQNKKMHEEIMIPEFISQQSASEVSSLEFGRKQKIRKQLKSPKQKFEHHEAPMTHYIHIAFFEDFCAYSQSELKLLLYQQIIPEMEYQNMKTPVCVCQKITLKKDKKIQRLFIPDKPIIFQLSEQGNQIWILLDNITNEIKQKLSIQLKNIRYAVDQSQLLYMKTDNMITCAGKLKMIVSPQPIDPQLFVEETTLSFLDKYLLKQQCTKQDKYRFVDYKKRNHELCQKWNNKIIKKIINKSDQSQFSKAIFNGLPHSISKKLSSLKPTRSITRTQTRIESKSSTFNTGTYNLIQNEIMKMKVYDLRVYVKISHLIDIVMNTKKHHYMQTRLDQITMFYQFKFGRGNVEKILAVFVIQVLRKVEGLLLHMNSSKQIQAFFVEYFDVQYEIDDLMTSVSAYFN